MYYETKRRWPVVVLTLCFSCAPTTFAQSPRNDAEQRERTQLELKKLKLEIEVLENQTKQPKVGGIPLQILIAGVLGLLGGLTGYVVTWKIAKQKRSGDLDQAIHEARIDHYPDLVRARLCPVKWCNSVSVADLTQAASFASIRAWL